MPNFNLVTRIHVLTAIRTHDQEGAEIFALEHGVQGTPPLVLIERGRRYDPRPLLIFAYEKATGTRLASHELPVDLGAVLTKLDFKFATRDELEKPAVKSGARAPRVSKPKAPAAPAKAEPVVALCPSCYMQLPATGVCNYCD